MSWPIEIDGHSYEPIPESWIAHSDAEDRRAGSPRIYAVSAATDFAERRLRIRYAHPIADGVLVYTTGANEIETGVVPAGLVERGSHWPRSIVPRTDPTDVVRDVEREHMRSVWGSRVDEIPTPDQPTDRQLVADGGIARPAVCVDTLEYDGAETHDDSIEGEVTRHYYDCPSCGHPIAAWMDCPECLWYDEDVWARTLSEGGRSA